MRKILILAVVALFVGLTACQKAQDELYQLDFARAFIPANFDHDPVQRPSITRPTVMELSTTLSWRTSPNIHAYELQITTDTTFGTIDREITLHRDSLRFVMDELPFLTWYGARVRALAPLGSEQENSHWNTLVFQTPAEQLFLPFRRGDVRSESVFVRWHEGAAVTHIEVIDLRTGDLFRRVDLTAQNINDAELLIEGLGMVEGEAPAIIRGAPYRVDIFSGDALRGQLNFETNSRANRDHPGVRFLEVGDDLRPVLENLGTERVIVLPDGFEQVFTTGNIAISGTVHIFGDQDGDRPAITLDAGIGHRFFILPETADSIVFEGIDIIGAEEPVAGANAFFYVINQATNEASNVRMLRFENTVVRNFGEGFIRLQGTATGTHTHIENLVLENSIMTDFSHERLGGRFGFINIGNTGSFGLIDNIVITNTTIARVEHSFMNIVGTTGGSEQVVRTILFDNVTFDRVVSDLNTRYLIDGQTHSNIAITIRNTIFGSTNGPEARGIRVHNDSPIVVSNSFRTRDWVTTNPEAPSTEDFHIPSLMNYSGGRENMFADPDYDDFFLRDVGFAGRSTTGDPRWRP